MKDGNQMVWVLVLLFLVFSGNLGSFVGPAPPFVTDQPSVLVVEETEQRTTALTSTFMAIQSQFAAGHYRQLDKDNPPTQDEKWVQDAWAAWEKAGKQVPWVVAANKRSGVSQSVTAANTITLIQGLVK